MIEPSVVLYVVIDCEDSESLNKTNNYSSHSIPLHPRRGKDGTTVHQFHIQMNIINFSPLFFFCCKATAKFSFI